MSGLYEQLTETLAEDVEHCEGSEPLWAMRSALRAAVERHKPEQHYTIGQDNRRTPSRLYCRACRETGPCEELQDIAEKLGITEGEEHTDE